jgi:hypothetical protein
MPDPTSAAEEYAIVQGIAAPPKGRPDDPVGVVADVDFPVARRGYDRGAVDAYVRRMSQIVAELEATRSPDAAVHRAVERVSEQISGILQRARDTAEQITAQSRKGAEGRLEAARQEVAQIVADAAQRAEDLDAEAERIAAERRRLIDDARELAGQVIALTDAASLRFSSEDPTTGTPSDAADQAAVEPEAPEPDLGAESRLAELWALAGRAGPDDDLKTDLPPDQSGSQRSAAGKEQPGHPDDPDET